jgi:hypothetical protein
MGESTMVETPMLQSTMRERSTMGDRQTQSQVTVR